jgi:putative endonuclease
VVRPDGRQRRLKAERDGRRAERLAALWLIAKGYRVMGRRVRTPLGELDLVMRAPSGLVCFIEVKTRARDAAAEEALGARQQARIARAAELYLGMRPALRHKGVRFDVILVVPRRWPRHVRDAWRP